MDANLVRASRFQPAFDKRVIAKLFHDAHMSHGSLAVTRLGAATPPAIATIPHQVGLDAPRFGLPTHHCQITPFDRVCPELLAQMTLRLDSPREDNQTAGVLVEPMHCSNRRGASCSGLSQQCRQQIGERLWQETLGSFAELCRFLRMPHGGEPRWLFQDNHLRVGEADDRFITTHYNE